MGQYTTGEEGRKGWTLGKSIHRAEFLRRKRGGRFPFPPFLPDPFPVVVDHLEVGHGKEAGGKQGEKISQQEHLGGGQPLGQKVGQGGRQIGDLLGRQGTIKAAAVVAGPEMLPGTTPFFGIL